MAPEVHHSYQQLVTPKTPLLSRISPNNHLHHNCCRSRGRMLKLTKRKLIPVLALILCTASVSRFLNINMINSSSIDVSLQPPLRPHGCSSISLACSKDTSYTQALGRSVAENETSTLTDKEVKFLKEFFSNRVPCNLLVFGNAVQYLDISKLNAGGLTIFLDENLGNANSFKSINNTQRLRIAYHTTASEAFKLLKDARGNPDCSPNVQLRQVSKCKLALSNLPRQVYDTMWDVVVVDGPRGNSPDSPGRMASIYTASILARRGKATHVIVHDVNRMIEKWFTREFLCEENLISSKGGLQNFRIHAMNSSTTFCAS